jgi:hypothetical protein
MHSIAQEQGSVAVVQRRRVAPSSSGSGEQRIDLDCGGGKRRELRHCMVLQSSTSASCANGLRQEAACQAHVMLTAG